MASRFSRFRFAAAAAVSFSAGVLFASGMDWTKVSWAQGGTTSRSASVRGPMAPEGGSFADIAARVTPGVVAVNTTEACENCEVVTAELCASMGDATDAQAPLYDAGVIYATAARGGVGVWDSCGNGSWSAAACPTPTWRWLANGVARRRRRRQLQRRR